MIAIVDYGVGNVKAIQNIYDSLNIDNVVTSSKKIISESDKIVLPGVGAFDSAITKLNKLQLIKVLQIETEIKNKPILGICLGMQLLAESSDEGTCKGLSLVKGKCERFDADIEHKVPHMGWNTVSTDSLLIGNKSSYYFSHSYHLKLEQEVDILGTTEYGINFVSFFQSENVLGVQFHPERSGDLGIDFLEKFGKL